MRDISSFLDAVHRWAEAQTDIDAVALVGSFARGAARADSDVDLVIITRTPRRYLEDAAWLSHFGVVTRLEDEDWGLLQGRRTFYTDGLEVEFGITTPQWASVAPVDAGTREVIADGAQIVSDPHGMLERLLRAVNHPN